VFVKTESPQGRGFEGLVGDCEKEIVMLDFVSGVSDEL